MSQLIDLSKLTRRKVDMNVLPEYSKPMQQMIYEEAAKRLKAQQKNLYKGICIRSESEVDSYERSFDDRVARIIKDSLIGYGEFILPEIPEE